jgi:DNA-binding GntR family transcriptional regulator
MNGFTQVQPLYKQAYEALKKSILTGEISSGSRLVATQLAEKYQVSRTPLREALRLLENDGLLIQDKMGATVVQLNKKDFEELCECRLMLEKQIVELIVPTISNSQLNKIDKVLLQIEEGFGEENSIRTLELNSKFHGLLIEVCENKRLIQLLEQVRSMLILYRANIIRGCTHSGEIVKEHRNIFESIKNRDLESALLHTEIHLLNDKKRGLKMFSEEE